MDERSRAINCTESNGYTCLPDKNLTVLFEFCYKRARFAVPKGYCLFLRYSDVDAYDCKRFMYGCPDADYYSDEIYKYHNCVLIGSGCFLADASCDRIPAADKKTVKRNNIDLTKNTTQDYRVWSLSIGVMGAVIPLCTVTFIGFIFHKKKKPQSQQMQVMAAPKSETTTRVNKGLRSDYSSRKDKHILDQTDGKEYNVPMIPDKISA